MGVDAEGEAGVRVAEVLGDGLDGSAGIDEHGGVEVPQGVHAVVSAGLDTGGHEGAVPDAVVEVVAVERLVLPAGEHEILASCRVPAQVLGQLEGDGVRQRHVPGLAPLRSVDDESGAHELHLLFDVDLLAKKVDVADPKPEHLALAQAASGGDNCGGPVPVR